MKDDYVRRRLCSLSLNPVVARVTPCVSTRGQRRLIVGFPNKRELLLFSQSNSVKLYTSICGIVVLFLVCSW